MKLSNWLRLGGAALVTFALSACGGGGAGSDDLTITSDRDSFTLVGVNGSEMVTQPITFTMHGGEGTYYGMAVSDTATFIAGFSPQSETSATVTLIRVDDVEIGTRQTGNITLRLCSDANCGKVVWSQKFPYTATMYQVDTAPIAISGHERVASEPVPVSVFPADTKGELFFGSDDNFLAADHSAADRVDITADASELLPGSHSGAVSIGARIDGDAVPGTLGSIPVAFGVSSGILDPGAPPIEILATSTAATLTGAASIRFVEGESPAWTASTGSDWLVLDTHAGTGPGSVKYHIDTTKLAGIANWGSATAQVTVKGAPLSDRVFDVTLNKKIAEVRLATPSAWLANRSAEVRVVGRGLSQLTGPAGFDIGGVRPSSVTIESDTAATLKVPALSAGARTISAINQLGETQVAVASVAITEAGLFQTTTVENVAEPRAAVFDPTRTAVFAADGAQQALVRFQLVGGQWRVTKLQVADVGRLALSPDRRTLYIVSGSNLLDVDPDAMRVRKTHRGTIDMSSNGTGAQPLPITSDLRLWMPTESSTDLTYFDLQAGTFGTQSAVFEGGQPYPLLRAVVFAPANGSQALIANAMAVSPPMDNLWYSPATTRVSKPEGVPLVHYNAYFDDRGMGMLVDDDTLYQPSGFKLRGHAAISGNNGEFGTNAVVSPDGQRVYRQVADAAGTITHVQVFDTSRLMNGSSDFATVGTIALPAQANDCSPPDTCARSGLLIIDPAGTTLFSVGRSRMIVMPIPDNLSGMSAMQAARPLEVSARLLKATAK